MLHSKVSVLLTINVKVKGCKAIFLTEIYFTGGAAITKFRAPSSCSPHLHFKTLTAGLLPAKHHSRLISGLSVP
uniref:Uncharacterized protein n=1 Tax=Arion vulgaris TaxID=1028688 RepID=A0A0B7AYL7_9EUPU